MSAHDAGKRPVLGLQHVCAVEDCVRTHVARGLCMTHYRRLLRRGHPLAFMGGTKGKFRKGIGAAYGEPPKGG
jgi:hypothetical protein